MGLAPVVGPGQLLSPDRDQAEDWLPLGPQDDVEPSDVQEPLRRRRVDVGPVEEEQLAPFEDVPILSNFALLPAVDRLAPRLLGRGVCRLSLATCLGLAACLVLAGH